jgi:FkbM family methyltransferase
VQRREIRLPDVGSAFEHAQMPDFATRHQDFAFPLVQRAHLGHQINGTPLRTCWKKRILGALTVDIDNLPLPSPHRQGRWFGFRHEGQTFRVWIDEQPNSLQDIIVRTGDFYEAETLAMIREILPPSARIVDVGANIGNHAIYFDRVCGAEKVFVIEPNADVIEDLVANTEANDCKAVDLSLTGFAVGAETGSGALYISPGDDAIRNRGGVTVKSERDTSVASVSVRRLDDLDLGHVDFLKIDVEGKVLDVLRGASGLLGKCRPAMLLEVDLPDLPAFTRWLSEAGYDMTAVVEHQFGVLNVLLSPKADVSADASEEVVCKTGRFVETSARQWAALDVEGSAALVDARKDEAFAEADLARARAIDAEVRIANALSQVHKAESELEEVKARLANAEKRADAVMVPAPQAQTMEAAMEKALHTQDTRRGAEQTFWRKLFFREGGRPKKALRRLLFHGSGRPRGVFKKYIVHPDGRPRAAFEEWMTSAHYQGLPDISRRAAATASAVEVAHAPTGELKKKRPRRPGKHVLFIDSVLPDPTLDSGSVDTINYVTWLRSLGYEVHFLSTSFGKESVSERHVFNAGAKILRLHGKDAVMEFLFENGHDFDLFFLSRVHCGGIFFEACRQSNPGACVIFNTVDLHFLREEREARIRNDIKALFRSAEVRERELYVARQSDLTIVVSGTEKEIVEAAAPGTNVAVMSLFRPLPPQVGSFDDRSGIGFIGGFAHVPNVDAIDYFLSDVWPLIHDRAPSIRLEIAGAGLPKRIAEALPEGVVYKGHIPDLEGWIGKLRLTVAPLRYGAGAKGKVASSVVNGVPVIGTSVAFEGMGLGPEATVAADDPERMAQEIIRVHGDREAWVALSRGARDFGEANLSPEAGQKRFAQMLSNLPVQRADDKT